MTMLSRVAERLYWMARYQERAEDTARLVHAYTHLLMDLPKGSEMDWDVLVRIFDATPAFVTRQRKYGEQSVLRFLLAERQNPCSILFSVKCARENVRTTRDVLPEKAWEYINELYLYVDERADKSVGRRNRYEFLEQVVMRSQQINGLLLTTLNHDHSYRFIKMGRLLERADMASRVVDTCASIIIDKAQSNPGTDSLLWGYILEALGANSSYRRYIGPDNTPSSIIQFVLRESSFPRAIIFCLRGILEEINSLPNNTLTRAALDDAIDTLTHYKHSENQPDKLHRHIEKLQQQLGEINDLITDNWFLPH